MRAMRCGLAALMLSLAGSLLRAQDRPADSHTAAALELMEVTRVRAVMEQMYQATHQALGAQFPELDSVPGLDSLIGGFLNRHFRWQEIETEFADVYVAVFSEAELRQMIAFYRTDLGEMMLARLPDVIQRSMLVTQRRMEQVMPAMMQEIDEFVRRRYQREP